jgi:penicillin-binding protein 2
MLVSNEYGTSRFVCWTGHGPQDVISGIADSCDIYFYNLGGGSPDGKLPGLGSERLANWAKLFGLGAKTGIDLPDEVVGVVPTASYKKQEWNEDWYLGDTYNMSIGQGFVASTPIQMANVMAATVNGGKLYQPQMVKEVVDSDGNVIRPFAPKLIRQIPVDQANLELIKQGMRDNMIVSGVTPYGTRFNGTAWTDEVPGINMIAKTGTAEYGDQLDPATGHLPTHGWFVAAAPMNNPKVVLAVFVDNGRGSQEAGDLAKRIMTSYFGVTSNTS